IRSIFGAVGTSPTYLGIGSQLSANGGSVIQGAVQSVAGKGGNGSGNGFGGAGGNIDIGSGAGAGGGIKVDALGNIYLPNYQANGGSIFGDYSPKAGNGGNAGATDGQGGKGGDIAVAGSGGAGGMVEVKSLLGNILIVQALAKGGDAQSLTATPGNGGSQLTGTGDGGAGGVLSGNGVGGMGGSISVSTFGSITSLGDFNVGGGSTGGVTATGGSGGTAGGPRGTGGAGGLVGDNGNGGAGGRISIAAYDSDISINGNLFANGGNVLGDHNGIGGAGGNGTSTGGEGGGVGKDGQSGKGGSVEVTTRQGDILLNLGFNIYANGGSTSMNRGVGGAGGNGGTGLPGESAGSGGSVGDDGVGAGCDGGWGGSIKLQSTAGDIKLQGSVFANGANGGSVTAFGGNGGQGNPKGLNGGTVFAAGDGGWGGMINLTSCSGALSSIGLITANAGNGGSQVLSHGGNGGNGAPLPAGLGGNGGDMWRPGNGGTGGYIQVYGTPMNLLFPPTVNAGLAGLQLGTPGLAGTPTQAGYGNPGVYQPVYTHGQGINGFPGLITNLCCPPPTSSPPLFLGEAENSSASNGSASFVTSLQSFLRASFGASVFSQNNQIQSSSSSIISTDKTPVNKENSPLLGLNDLNTNPFPLKGEIFVTANVGNQKIGFFTGSDFNAEEVTALSRQSILTGQSSGNSLLVLDRGTVLLAPRSDVQIKTKEGDVFISAGAVALVIETGNDVALYNLHDGRKDSVKFVSNKKSISLAPGNQLVLTRSGSKTFNDVNPGPKLGYRNQSKYEFGNGVTAFMAEFPLISLMMELNRELKPQGKQEQDFATLRKKMLLTAAALQVATGSHGPFKPAK
ncbi:MAG: hypothetical protein K2X27_16090, partial [Candidatus Obscuribacterales bacterium]|nr:hypothetical protein [Candidatus Obscuribacterales bacterium]